MKIKSFKAENFRNIEKCELEFSDGVNLLCGDNAQGKTNAVEGIYVFARGRSFRASEDKEMVKFGEDGFRISITFEDKNGESTLEYACFGRERLRKKNGYKITKAAEMIGDFKAVLFYPDNLDLVKAGPEERRSFLNVAISQCFPEYIRYYSNFKSALDNRNKLLKIASKGMFVDDKELYSWSSYMAEYSAYIYLLRKKYIDLLSKKAKVISEDISCKKEEMSLFYKSDVEGDLDKYEDVKKEYIEIYTRNIEKEKIVGSSLYGPQRDDMIIELCAKSAKSFASQGQQRSCVLSLKLAEGEVIKDLFSEYPVFLFDDVLSELDEGRRKYVLEGAKDKQIIITSCEKDEVQKNAQKLIEVKGGSYVSSYR